MDIISLNFMKFFSWWPEKNFESFEKEISKYIASTDKEIHIYSVFGPPPTEKDSNVFYVQFSGESWWHDPSLFDQNFIMAEPSPFFFGPFDLKWQGTWGSIEQSRKLCPEKRKFCCFIVSNPECVERNTMFHRLHEKRHVDSYGRLFRNSIMPYETRGPEYIQFISQYRFMICFENKKQDWYLTEKIYNAYAAGCIPIYWGCPQIKEILNEKAFLLLEDIHGIDALVDRIIEIDEDEEKYLEIFNQPLTL